MEEIFQDENFKKEPYPVKLEVANNYFEREIATDGFSDLSPAEQEKARNNFIFSQIGGDPVKINKDIPENGQQMYYDKNGIGWNQQYIDQHPQVYEGFKTFLTAEADRLQKEATDRVNVNMTKETINKLTKAIDSKDTNELTNALGNVAKLNEVESKTLLRYPLGVAQVGENLWNKVVDFSSKYEGFGWLQNSTIVSDFIKSNEAQIKALQTKLGYAPSDSITPSNVTEFLAEAFGIGKLLPTAGVLKTSAAAGGVATTREIGKGQDWRTAISDGSLTAGATLIGGAAFKGIEYMIRGGKSAKDVIEYIKKNDEIYNTDESIDVALQNYYKVFEPSNNVNEDKVRALLYGSQRLGSEIKIGAEYINDTRKIIPTLRKQTQEIKNKLQEASFSPTGIQDAGVAIKNARNSTAYKDGMKIIEDNFNADVPLDKAVWSKLSAELDNISQLSGDDPILKNLSNQISTILKSDNPTVPLRDLIDWEQDIGAIAFSKYGSKKGFKLSMGDKYVSDLVEGALQKQPEGIALYRTMKDMYQEVSVFKDTAGAKQKHMIGVIIEKMNNKKITPDTALQDLLKLKEFGEKPLEQLAQIGGADVAQNFENAVIQGILKNQKNLDYPALAKSVNKIGFITENGKQLKNIINNLNDVIKSEQIDDRLRNLLAGGDYDGTTITADLLAKAKYAVAGNIWNRLKAWVIPSAREAKNTAEILEKAGDILSNPNALKSFSKIDDMQLRQALNSVAAQRVATYTEAKAATGYEALRVQRKAENQAKMLKAQELAKAKKAGNLGFSR